jgi:hypothetical protein
MKTREGVKVQLYPFFNFSARWKWVVSATLRLVYSRVGDPILILNWAGWGFGTSGWVPNISHPPGFDPRSE